MHRSCFRFSSTSYRMRPQSEGISHELKIARLLSIFAPVCALGPLFRFPYGNKKSHTEWCGIFYW